MDYKFIIKRTYSGLKNLVKPKQDLLVYLGMHHGASFDYIFKNFRKCIAFEANPDSYQYLANKYENYPHVEIIHAAVADEDGELEFNISSNNSESSSIGDFREEWQDTTHIEMKKKVKVPAINLYNFLQKRNIDYIDEYHSDIQGMDLQVLKQLKPYIDEQKIGLIISETAKDEYRNIYKDLPDNSFSGFKKLFADKYYLAGKGWSKLKEGKFEEVPEDWWEFDSMWKPFKK